MARRNANGEGTIYQRKDGRYEGALFVQTVSGRRKRVRVYGATRGEAHARLVDAKADANSGVPVPDHAWRLGDYLDYWLENVVRPTKRSATYEQCRRVAQQHLKPTLGRYQLKELSVPIVQAYLNAKLADSGTLPLLQVIRKVLSAALTSAMREERVTRNVARLTVLPTYDAPDRPEPWDAAEIRRFLELAQPEPLYPAFALLLMYGMRRGEVLGLTWGDIDVGKMTIVIRQQLQRTDGKLALAPLKTRASKRPLPMLNFAWRTIQAHRDKQQAEGIPVSAESLVFTSSEGGPLEPSTLIRSFRKACLKLGMRAIRVHDTRHGLATLLKDLKIPVRDAQLILGHARVSTTQELYQHDRAENRRKSLEAVEDALVGQQKSDEYAAHRLVESDRCRQFYRQVGYFADKITASIFGAGQGTLTPGLVLGKSSLATKRARMTKVNSAWNGRRRQHLIGVVAVSTAVKANFAPLDEHHSYSYPL